MENKKIYINLNFLLFSANENGKTIFCYVPLNFISRINDVGARYLAFLVIFISFHDFRVPVFRLSVVFCRLACHDNNINRIK